MYVILLAAAAILWGLAAAFSGYRYYSEDPVYRSSWNWTGIFFTGINILCLYFASLQAAAQGVSTMYFGALFIFGLIVYAFASWRGSRRRMREQPAA